MNVTKDVQVGFLSIHLLILRIIYKFGKITLLLLHENLLNNLSGESFSI